MARRDEGFFSAKDDTRLYWRSLFPDGAFADVVAIVHGYGDHSGRYQAVMEALVAQGHGTIALDYRGHGRADGHRADVKKWGDYLGDMEAFWARVRTLAEGKPTFVLAHSNGGLIVTHWAAGHPEGLAGLVLSAPFYQMAFEPPALKLLGARVIKGLLPGLHIGNELKIEQLSRDAGWQRTTAEDPLYLHVTTPRWFFETMGAQAQVGEKAKAITQPLLVVAGGEDPIASMPAAKAAFEKMGSADKTWKEYAGMRHEVLNEVGKEQLIDDISRWISSHR